MKRLTWLLVLVLGTFVLAGCGAQAEGVQTIGPDAYVSQFETPGGDHLLIDVRTPQEFADGHIEGAINIPLQEISNRLNEIPTDQTLVLYCRSGNRSAQAAGILADEGYTGIYDLGGIIAWQGAGYALTRG